MLCILSLLSPAVAQAYSQLFDWSAQGWTPNGTGSLPRTYIDVGGTGVDVVVNIEPTTHFISTTPQTDGANGLRNYLDFDNNTESTTFTFSFFETGTTAPAAVVISDLTTKDLDSATYQDAITFAAIPFGGGTAIVPDQIQFYAGTHLNLLGSNSVYANSNTSVGVTDVEGWATASYQNLPVQSFTIEYHNGPDADPDPDQQWMWISDFTFSSATDFGDAPVSYSDASHDIVSPLYMGTTATDNESTTQGNDGLGDNNDGNDDEQGVIFIASGGAVPQEVTAEISVINDSGADAFVCGWMDQDLNGIFDLSDAHSCQTVADNNGTPDTVSMIWTGLPQTQGTTYARFRLCNTFSLCSGPNNTPLSTTASETLIGSDPFPDGSGTSCVTPVIKTFSIADSFTISDVELTLNITHTYRDDFNIFLESPAGTSVDLTTRGSIGSGADNLHVVFDDEAAINYIDDTSLHSPPPPLQPRVPVSPLNAFDGENSAGTWTLNMCDSWGGDTGNFDSATLDIFGPSTGGPALSGEVEDYRIDFDFRPTAVTIGEVQLDPVQADNFLSGLGADDMTTEALLALLTVWDPATAAGLTSANRVAILDALRRHLDPDGDGQVAVLYWNTLEERGTIGFYAERKHGNSDWIRLNDKMLPGLITAPMGGEYQLADPSAQTGQSYQYQLIELEARGTIRHYGPFNLEMVQ